MYKNVFACILQISFDQFKSAERVRSAGPFLDKKYTRQNICINCRIKQHGSEKKEDNNARKTRFCNWFFAYSRLHDGLLVPTFIFH
jgi:hypothetical protein